MGDEAPPRKASALDLFGEKKRASYEELLDRVQKEDDVALHAEPRGEGRWTVAVAAADRLGLLSIISGLLTAHGIDISNGDLFSFQMETKQRPPGRKDPGRLRRDRRRRGPAGHLSRKILDVFEVEAEPVRADAAFWESFRDELAALVGETVSGDSEKAREEIVDRISAVIRATPRSEERLLPVSIEIDNDASEHLTKLHIVSTDTLGFLFAFTNALAMLDVDIEHGEIRTIEEEARDTFWIRTSRGKKIEGPEKLRELRVACALIKQFTHLLPFSANPGQALRQFKEMVRLALGHPAWAEEFSCLQSLDVMHTMAELMGVSRFLWEDFLRMQHENLFPLVRDPATLRERRSRQQLAESLDRELETPGDHKEKVRILNTFKDREMFRIDLRHITGRIGDIPFARELSDLTDVVVARAASLCHEQLTNRYGEPLVDGEAETQGKPCDWSVLAAGKFGGREMGFASDIELLFVYRGKGWTRGPESIDNGSYFEELVRLFLRNVKSRQEGIFQIDLRLRPHGSKGTLACSLSAFEEYYATGGPARQFERMALTKLRPVAGSKDLAKEVVEARDALVYSGEPLDYENIRHLRRRQAEELVGEQALNAKYSPGGLVDLEYFVQAKQIEWGKNDERVRVTNTMQALARLEQTGKVDAKLAGEIRRAYRCLRRVIDALRAVRGNAKDLTIPPSGSRAFRYLARRLEYEDSGKLREELEWSMALGRRLWDEAPDS